MSTADIAIQRASEHHNLKKATEHLLGLCTGLVADQHLNDTEIQFLATWIKQHPDVTAGWPGKTIARRITEITRDGIITDEERADLLITLNSVCGNDFAETGSTDANVVTLPYDDDPHVLFSGRSFCLTGRFFHGTRNACEKALSALGGIPRDNVVKDLDYLVVGSLISDDWAHTPYGRKIELAMRYIEQGEGIALISEQQWSEALGRLQA
ncbi:BRCT domain-containing protein [Jeongeupia sp. USM3]|uniref:BRCT domain-containing protein n=1 Tax=Jeongeupia sp. USM3 TaxID=1906741 RepID=UPI00089DF1BD|nr:BRCT domain-containing protein [Jeongeupia sp. USM3]AOY00122.1 hypothetical protein BJP62_06450 [Jeongeupia sp. USM3]